MSTFEPLHVPVHHLPIVKSNLIIIFLKPFKNKTLRQDTIKGIRDEIRGQ